MNLGKALLAMALVAFSVFGLLCFWHGDLTNGLLATLVVATMQNGAKP